MSISTIGLQSDIHGGVNASRSGYLFKPFCGKQFSKSNISLSPCRSADTLLGPSRSQVSSSSLVLSPLSLPLVNNSIHQSEPLDSINAPHRSWEGSNLQIGLPEEDSRLPSPNLQVPILSMHQAQFQPTASNFDDEGFLASEFHSERDSLVAPNENRQLDNPFSLDISEKPQSESQIFNLHNSSLNDPVENEIRDWQTMHTVGESNAHRMPLPKKILQNSTTRLSNKPNLSNAFHSELNAHSTISTLGESKVVPFAVHNRVLGWKLTSVEKRKQLVDILDAVHGQRSPDLQMRLRKSRVLEAGVQGKFDASLKSQLAPFGTTKSLPELKKSLMSSAELHSHSKHSLTSKTRQTIAYEDFIARSVSSRQGFRSVQQIRNYMEDQKKLRESREKIIAAQKQKFVHPLGTKLNVHYGENLPQLQSQSQSTSEQQVSNPHDQEVNVNFDGRERSLTVRPYVPVGTLTATDKFGQSSDSITLRNLVQAALFEDDIVHNEVANRHDQDIKESKVTTMSSAEKLYNFPVNIYRPRSRMDILDSVKIRHEVEPSLGGTQWKEDQLVDAFIVGRQNARLRRSRDQNRQDSSHSHSREIKSNHKDFQNSKKNNSSNNSGSIQPELSPSKDSLKMELLGDGWDNDSVLSMSTSAEENEAALSEALLENFGLSLRDNELDDEISFNDPVETGSDFNSLSSSQISRLPEIIPSISTTNLNNSFADSEIGTNHPLDAPSLHPPQPHSTGSTINNQQLDDDNSWVD